MELWPFLQKGAAKVVGPGALKFYRGLRERGQKLEEGVQELQRIQELPLNHPDRTNYVMDMAMNYGVGGITKKGGDIIDLALRKRLKNANVLDDLRVEAAELNRLMELAKEFVNLNYMDWEDLARQHANVDIYTNILDDLTKQGLSENEQILRVGGRNVYDRIKALTKIKDESRSLLDDLMKQDDDLKRRWAEAYDRLHPPVKD